MRWRCGIDIGACGFDCGCMSNARVGGRDGEGSDKTIDLGEIGGEGGDGKQW